MKILAKIILNMALVSPVVHADHTAAPPSESQLVEHGSYVNKDGVRDHSPAHTKSGEQPAAASAQCRDLSYSSADITKACLASWWSLALAKLGSLQK